MAIVSISRIQIRRGRKNAGSGLPQLAGGELGWAVDSQELYIGNGAVSEGAPAVGNSKVLTEHDNLFELSDQYTYRNGSNIQTGVTSATPIKRSLQDRLDDVATGLSGGQQQRLCIARAISIKPEIILMDEPCSALDPIATAKIEQLINELKQNYTIIIVTHSMAQASRVSYKTAFFHLGNLVEYGDTSKIFTKPDNQKTNDYITGRFG